VAAVPGGGFYVAGSFEGTVEFAPGDLRTSAGYEDAFVTRFDGRGEALWTRTFGGTHTDLAAAIVVTADDGVGVAGGVSVAGSFGGEVDLDPGPREALVTKVGSRSGPFVLRLSATGEHVASRSFASAIEPDTGHALALAADGRGGLLVAGSFLGTLPLGDGREIASGDTADGFVLALDAGARVRWATIVAGRGPPGDDDALVAAGAGGEVWVAGASRRDDGGTARSDGYAARMALADGRVEAWASLTGAPRIEPRALATTADGGVAIAGALAGETRVGDGARALHVRGDVGFVLRLGPDATAVWGRATDDDTPAALCPQPDGSLWVGAGSVLRRLDETGQDLCVSTVPAPGATLTALAPGRPGRGEGAGAGVDLPPRTGPVVSRGPSQAPHGKGGVRFPPNG
jgi:hypothetical protein